MATGGDKFRLGRQDRLATASRQPSVDESESDFPDVEFTADERALAVQCTSLPQGAGGIQEVPSRCSGSRLVAEHLAVRRALFDVTPPLVRRGRANVARECISDRQLEINGSDKLESSRKRASSSSTSMDCLRCALDFVPPQVRHRRANVATESLSDIYFATEAALSYRYALASLLSEYVPPQVRLRRANVATDCISDRVFENDHKDQQQQQPADPPPAPISARASHGTMHRLGGRRVEQRLRRRHAIRLCGFRPTCGGSACSSQCGAGCAPDASPYGLKPGWMTTAEVGSDLSTTASGTPSTTWTSSALHALMPGEGWLSAQMELHGSKNVSLQATSKGGTDVKLAHELDLPLVDPAFIDEELSSANKRLETVLPGDAQLRVKKKFRWPNESRVCKDCRPLLSPRRGHWLKYAICEHRHPIGRLPMPRSFKQKLRQTYLARVRRGECARRRKKRRRCIHLKASCKLCHGCPHGNLRYRCAICRPCPHGMSARSCEVCKKCEHGVHKERCELCNACIHGSLRSACLICSGCPHGKLRSACRHCRSCRHGRLPGNCPECRGCEHGRLKAWCADCNPCEHGRPRLNCRICWGCPHGKLKRFCSICNPCPHGRRKEHCVDCSGCEHGKLTVDCHQCSGCPHGRVKRFCATCTPTSRWFCPHGKRKQSCLDCSACPHGRISNACPECKACPHGQVRRFCRFCNGCPHGRLQRFCGLCRGQGRANGRGRSGGRTNGRGRGCSKSLPS